MFKKKNQVLSKKSDIKVHFIGIGGIGTSALAQWLLRRPQIYTDLLRINTDTQIKLAIFGSDLEDSDIIKDLKKLGAKIKIGPHRASNLNPKTDLVIYSLAIGPQNPELKKARKLKIKALSYPEALGILTKKFYTIAVCGAHGKSTTTAMLSLVLIKAGFDPTVVIGTKLREFGGSNFRLGGNDSVSLVISGWGSGILLIEADEYKGAFLNYWPKMIILTNIDVEHLDYYKNLKGVVRAFGEFIRHLSKDRILIVNDDDKNSKFQILNSKQYQNPKFKIQKYSIKHRRDFIKLKKILKIPGKHNISNALAVLTVARALGISNRVSFKALSEYRGAWRRFEIIEANLHNNNHRSKLAQKFLIISDYAHHPTEIKATLQATAEKFPKKRIICVFQPHQEERLKLLFNDFAEAFKGVKNLILVESFKVAGREKGEKASKTHLLAETIRKKYGQEVLYAPNLKKAEELIRNNVESGDVVLIMGAGDVYKLNSKLQNPNSK